MHGTDFDSVCFMQTYIDLNMQHHAKTTPGVPHFAASFGWLGRTIAILTIGAMHCVSVHGAEPHTCAPLPSKALSKISYSA